MIVELEETLELSKKATFFKANQRTKFSRNV